MKRKGCFLSCVRKLVSKAKRGLLAAAATVWTAHTPGPSRREGSAAAPPPRLQQTPRHVFGLLPGRPVRRGLGPPGPRHGQGSVSGNFQLAVLGTRSPTHRAGHSGQGPGGLCGPQRAARENRWL